MPSSIIFYYFHPTQSKHAYRKFFTHAQSEQISIINKAKPSLPTSRPILFIIHIGGFHLVALVRQVVNSTVTFYYSNDMNSQNTKDRILSYFNSHYTDSHFFPPSAEWVNCSTYSYYPHSNECGPRTLLALLVMVLHPCPHSTMLLPFMHPNLSEISWWWTAKTILSQKFDKNTILAMCSSLSPLPST
jgi:hypothetical protein